MEVPVKEMGNSQPRRLEQRDFGIKGSKYFKRGRYQTYQELQEDSDGIINISMVSEIACVFLIFLFPVMTMHGQERILLNLVNTTLIHDRPSVKLSMAFTLFHNYLGNLKKVIVELF
jgi:hypothetical protein